MNRRFFIKSLAASMGIGVTPKVQSIDSNNLMSSNLSQKGILDNYEPFIITVVGVGKKARSVLNHLNHLGTEGVNYVFTDVEFFQNHMEATWIDGPPNNLHSYTEVSYYKNDTAAYEIPEDINSSIGNVRRFQSNQLVMLIADMSDDAAKLMVPEFAKVIKEKNVWMSVSFSLISGSKGHYFPYDYFQKEYMPSYILDDVSEIGNHVKSKKMSNQWLLTSETRYESAVTQIKSMIDMVYGISHAKYFTDYISDLTGLGEFLFQGTKACLLDVTVIKINRENTSSLISEFILQKRRVSHYRGRSDQKVFVNVFTGRPFNNSKKVSNIYKYIRIGLDDNVLFKATHIVNDSLEDDDIEVVLLTV